MMSGRRLLNILQVGSGFPGWGGTELHLLNLAQQLAERGHRVTVTARPEKFVEQEALKRGLTTFPITVRRQWDFKEARRIRELIRRESFDVVHVHWSTDYVVTPLIARQLGVPAVVMSRHSPYALKSSLGKFLYEKVLFDRIIALSGSVRRTLVGQGIHQDRVVTIHHGTDTHAFRHLTLSPESVREEWGIPPGAFVVGLAGRIAEEKGWRTFLQAVAREHSRLSKSSVVTDTDRVSSSSTGVMSATNAPLYAVLIGDGPQAELAKETTRELGIADQVIFAGFRSDVNNAINALDTLVLASVWEEPCAAVVQQAMALGKPVIGTNIGGTPEMVADGETGILVPPGDDVALAAAIRDLACEPRKRAYMGASGAVRADALFTLSRMTDNNEALYLKILQEKQEPPRI